MLDATRVQFVYFDLDDTLLDHRLAERTALARCRESYPSHFDGFDIDHVHAVFHRHNLPLWRAYANGEISREDVQRLRFEALIQELKISDLEAHELGSHYLSCYAENWTWRPGAQAAFLTIAATYGTGILTNGFSDIQHAKLERFPVLRRESRAVVVSEDFGVMKPDRRIFDHAAAKANANPENILYVGDSLHSDVLGGIGAGWQVAWLEGDQEADTGAFAFTRWDDLVQKLLPSQ